MGRHDQMSHYLHPAKDVKFKHLDPSGRVEANITRRLRRLGNLNRRG